MRWLERSELDEEHSKREIADGSPMPGNEAGLKTEGMTGFVPSAFSGAFGGLSSDIDNRPVQCACSPWIPHV